MKQRVFENRREAGRLLAGVVARRKFPNPLVLALPRGGVPVAMEVAARLKAPLDIVLVRKIGAPLQAELAVGAVVDGGLSEIVTNNAIIQETGTSEAYIQEEALRQLAIIEARRKLWIAGRTRVPVTGRTAIVVDDGIATGATVRAALHALRRQKPRWLVVATPVAPPDTVQALKAEADEVICLEMPRRFAAIGNFYRDFAQVDDGEVTAILNSFSVQGGALPVAIVPK